MSSTILAAVRVWGLNLRQAEQPVPYKGSFHKMVGPCAFCRQPPPSPSAGPERGDVSLWSPEDTINPGLHPLSLLSVDAETNPPPEANSPLGLVVSPSSLRLSRPEKAQLSV